MIRIVVSGFEKLEKVRKIFERSRKELHKQLIDACRKFSMDIVNTSKLNYLSGPRPDKLDVVTGRLRNSIKSKVITDVNNIQVIMGTDVIYGQIHEFGGFAGPHRRAFIRARPFLKPAIEQEYPKFKEKLERILGKAGIVDALKDI